MYILSMWLVCKLLVRDIFKKISRNQVDDVKK